MELGGLGVRDLERTAFALRLRLMWKDKVEDHRTWNSLGLQFRPLEKSFFASATVSIGNGRKARLRQSYMNASPRDIARCERLPRA
jgi:hypothetical protein